MALSARSVRNAAKDSYAAAAAAPASAISARPFSSDTSGGSRSRQYTIAARHCPNARLHEQLAGECRGRGWHAPGRARSRPWPRRDTASRTRSGSGCNRRTNNENTPMRPADTYESGSRRHRCHSRVIVDPRRLLRTRSRSMRWSGSRPSSPSASNRWIQSSSAASRRAQPSADRSGSRSSRPSAPWKLAPVGDSSNIHSMYSFVSCSIVMA